jgi:hypothetical protein
LRYLVEREDAKIDIPILHIHLSMRCIRNTVDGHLHVLRALLLCLVSNRLDDFFDWHDRTENVRAGRECDNARLRGYEREDIVDV